MGSEMCIRDSGKENGYEFTQEELEIGWEELQESEEGLTDFELEVVSGGSRSLGTYTPSPPGRKLPGVSGGSRSLGGSC